MGITGYFGTNQHYGYGLGKACWLWVYTGLTGRAGRSLHLVIGSDVLGPHDGLATRVGTNLASQYSRTYVLYKERDPVERTSNGALPPFLVCGRRDAQGIRVDLDHGAAIGAATMSAGKLLQ